MTVKQFIEINYNEYLGDESFLTSTTSKTKKVLEKYNELITEELKKGVLDVELNKVSGINNFEAGYMDIENEVIVGLQTDAPLKRIVNLYGGVKMAEKSLEAYGYKLNEEIKRDFIEYRKSHNDGVFDVYNDSIKSLRKHGVITGLPDAYGRGRIIGDYRRVALFGVDHLINEKETVAEHILIDCEESIRLKEEVKEQIKALKEMKEMALKYGFDISVKAQNAKEAVQWVYFAYLAATKENNGAATSLGRVSTFLDIYIEEDLNKGIINEEEAQELIDQFVLKLRMIRHLRTPEYDELFAGDPTWVTEAIAGMTNGKSLVTKTSYRILHTLYNLGPSPEPNLTVLWSENLPDNFKKYCAKVSIETSSIQYENDDLMRPIYGSDYGISCCVSAMKIGEQMQYFGARCNLPKTLLYAINGGVDEITHEQVINNIEKMDDEYLDYNKVIKSYEKALDIVASDYTDAMNIIHYMHDKYAYEASQMALHDTSVERLMAFGIAGLSVAADSLSAIKYAKVKPIRDDKGIAIDFEVTGEFPQYGNDDDRVDTIAVELTKLFFSKLTKKNLYRNARHTMSVLTITSNVVYGKMTGSTPDTRKTGEPFAPGANPMHGRDKNGALASLNSVAKIPYEGVCDDGVSNTFSIVPQALGDKKEKNLVSIMDGYFRNKGHHLNINVFTKEKLTEAMNNPTLYPHLTIRVSGYAVHFNRLSRKQQEEVIARTFHEAL